jgi:hypothetical protein
MDKAIELASNKEDDLNVKFETFKKTA